MHCLKCSLLLVSFPNFVQSLLLSNTLQPSSCTSTLMGKICCLPPVFASTTGIREFAQHFSEGQKPTQTFSQIAGHRGAAAACNARGFERPGGPTGSLSPGFSIVRGAPGVLSYPFGSRTPWRKLKMKNIERTRNIDNFTQRYFAFRKNVSSSFDRHKVWYFFYSKGLREEGRNQPITPIW